MLTVHAHVERVQSRHRKNQAVQVQNMRNPDSAATAGQP